MYGPAQLCSIAQPTANSPEVMATFIPCRQWGCRCLTDGCTDHGGPEEGQATKTFSPTHAKHALYVAISSWTLVTFGNSSAQLVSRIACERDFCASFAPTSPVEPQGRPPTSPRLPRSARRETCPRPCPAAPRLAEDHLLESPHLRTLHAPLALRGRGSSCFVAGASRALNSPGLKTARERERESACLNEEVRVKTKS